jgi:pimeloyl-ACP methyl ester carboxylesterase
MGYKEEKVSVRNGMFEITVRRGGSGDPLVYLHAAGGQAEWEPVLELLAEKYEVIQPMHPGWPGSTGLEHLDDVVDMAIYYCDFFDTLGLKDVNLVGTSLGGMFAAEIGAIGRNYVRKLVLHAPAGMWLDEHPPLDFFAAPQDVLMKALFFDPEKAMARQPKVDPEDKEAMAQSMLNRAMSLAAAGKFIWPIWDKGLKKRIHRINMPTLIVWGEQDGLNPPVYGPHFQKQIAGSRLVTIPNSAHATPSDAPEAFATAVLDFLA